MTDETAKELAAAMRDLAGALNAIMAKYPFGPPTIYHQHSHSNAIHPQYPFGSPT